MAAAAIVLLLTASPAAAQSWPHPNTWAANQPTRLFPTSVIACPECRANQSEAFKPSLANPANERDMLFVWFGGGVSGPVAFKFLPAMAAFVGYHAISLSYPNAAAYHPDAQCENETTQPAAMSCYSRARLRSFLGSTACAAAFGTACDRLNPDEQNISDGSSVQARLLEVLKDLEVIDPGGGWLSYYDPINDLVNWDKVVVGGFSLGAGMAHGVAENVPVIGVLAVEGMRDPYRPGFDDSGGDITCIEDSGIWRCNALWAAGATPAIEYYGVYSSVLADPNAALKDQQLLGQFNSLGMKVVGSSGLEGDNGLFFYGVTAGHRWWSNQCNVSGDSHGAMAKDVAMPLTMDYADCAVGTGADLTTLNTLNLFPLYVDLLRRLSH